MESSVALDIVRWMIGRLMMLDEDDEYVAVVLVDLVDLDDVNRFEQLWRPICVAV